MTTSSISVSAETLKQLNTKIDELLALLNSLSSVVAETKHEPELVITYYDIAKTMKRDEYYTLNGKCHGKFTTYYRNGSISCVYMYINGKKHGIGILYTSLGAVQFVRKYDNGILMSEMNA